MTAWYNRGPYSVAHYSAGSVFNCVGLLPINFLFVGNDAIPVDVIGTMAIMFGFDAQLSNSQVFNGTMAILVDPDARLTGEFDFEGQADLTVTFDVADPEIYVGPLWQPAALCDDPGWAAAELCNG